jgi:hypothetical protein
MKITVQKFIDFKKKEVADKDFEMEMLKHFLNIDPNDKFSLVIATYQVRDLVALFSKDDHELIPTFTHKGVNYGFIPNIVDDLTLGEYIDLNTYSTETDDTIKWLSVLYRPITSKHGNLYTIEDYSGKVFPFEDLDVKVLLGAQFFFLHIAKKYQNHIQHSLKEEVVGMMN